MRPTPSNLLDFQRSTAPCAPRPALDRGVKVPDPRTVHLDDIRAELAHGRVGRAAADRRALHASRPMSLATWALLLTAALALCVAADVLVNW